MCLGNSLMSEVYHTASAFRGCFNCLNPDFKKRPPTPHKNYGGSGERFRLCRHPSFEVSAPQFYLRVLLYTMEVDYGPNL
jgi:hypothetical protein